MVSAEEHGDEAQGRRRWGRMMKGVQKEISGKGNVLNE